MYDFLMSAAILGFLFAILFLLLHCANISQKSKEIELIDSQLNLENENQ